MTEEYWCLTCSRYHSKDKSRDDCELDRTDFIGNEDEDEDDDFDNDGEGDEE